MPGVASWVRSGVSSLALPELNDCLLEGARVLWPDMSTAFGMGHQTREADRREHGGRAISLGYRLSAVNPPGPRGRFGSCATQHEVKTNSS